MSDSIGTSHFTYDADGRITGFTDPEGFTFSYTYDAAGNVTQVTYPDATAVTYGYDAANRLVTVTDPQGEQATWTYDEAGRPSSLTQFNGIMTTYAYDAASRLATMTSSVASYQFTLDGNGNRTNSVQSEPLKATTSTGGSTALRIQYAEKPAAFGRDLELCLRLRRPARNCRRHGPYLRLQPPACRQSEPLPGFPMTDGETG